MNNLQVLPVEMAHVFPKAKGYEDAKYHRDVYERALHLFDKGNYWCRLMVDELTGHSTGLFEVGNEKDGEEKTAYHGGPYIVNIVTNTCTCPHQHLMKYTYCKHSVAVQLWWNYRAKEVGKGGIVQWSLE